MTALEKLYTATIPTSPSPPTGTASLLLRVSPVLKFRVKNEGILHLITTTLSFEKGVVVA